ncbi:uncharacterized protein EI97DRAFT_216471 [Westerdykella ornata]|uniref:Uncharacterized protein n=1 Tax=Westerdykella ornata TaxID=318751 RepID=A0A6A6JQ56_WESOR|nr:uncharacterized protein EI97DRAFT_216471 [Westerdykella ornata]KAF2278672.1 hypothetical protein EI97DRAFT_216471 [Westerdykella ornata]
MDAGGLAQMTYNNNVQPSGGLARPSAGFASRGRLGQVNRLSLTSTPKVAPIAENAYPDVQTPRTSRGHLLAGLRTAPKTPSSVQPPASAPYHTAQHNIAVNQAGYLPQHLDAQQMLKGANYGVPQTAMASTFGTAVHHQLAQQQMVYGLPDQVLAPPSLDEGSVDPNLAAELLQTKLYLERRQQQLQQQLYNLTAQHLAELNMQALRQSQQYPSTPFTPQLNNYAQQFQNTQLAQETGQPGVYLTYNQLTGQYSYVVDQRQISQQQGINNLAQQFAETNLSHSPPPPTPRFADSPPKSAAPTVQVSPPNESSPSPWARSTSPPKKSLTPPQDVVPLPPPSANAFRRGHKKTVSSLALDGKQETPEGPKSAFVRPVGFPATPMTGTFGPGQGRAGEHPVRQPKGPPPLEELQSSPTSKHEGSKNFATRRRRAAMSNLANARIRRGAGSSGSMTPVSETEMSFPVSDNDSDSVHSGGSGSLSGKPSIGSLRAAANGAIGSELKASKERSRERTSTNGSYTANSVSSDEGYVGGGLVEIRAEEPQRRKMPMLVLTSAEKRKSTVY